MPSWRWRRSGVHALLAAVALAFAGCGKQGPVVSPIDGVATVDGKPIPLERLEQELERSGRGGRPEEVRQVLDELILREQLVARALRLGLDCDPVVRRAWEGALIARLKDKELEPALRAAPAGGETDGGSPAAAPARKPGPELVRLAVLRLGTHAKTSPEKRRRLEARLGEARDRVASLPPGTTGFGALALEYSEDAATRVNGGDLGWMEADPGRARLDPAALAAGLALATPGDLSPVVRGEDGIYLVRLVGRRAGASSPDAGVEDAALARHVRHLERRKAVEASFLEATRQAVPAVVNTALVEEIVSRRRAQADEVPTPPGEPLSTASTGAGR